MIVVTVWCLLEFLGEGAKKFGTASQPHSYVPNCRFSAHRVFVLLADKQFFAKLTQSIPCLNV